MCNKANNQRGEEQQRKQLCCFGAVLFLRKSWPRRLADMCDLFKSSAFKRLNMLDWGIVGKSDRFHG